MSGKMITAVLVIIAAAVGYVFYSSSTSEWNEMPETVEVTPPVETAAPEPEAPEQVSESQDIVPDEPAAAPEEVSEPEPAEPDMIMPPQGVDNSDGRFLEAARDVAQEMAQWLTPAEQVRRWVLAVDLMADGKIPYKHSPVKYDKDPFLVLKQGDERYVRDTGNYTRWKPLVSAVTEIPVEEAARYYREWLPLFERAYGELGRPGTFNQRFMQALNNIRIVDEAPAGAVLVRPHVFYQYEEQVLEEASPLTKWMWRLGPENMMKIQNFARNLGAELN